MCASDSMSVEFCLPEAKGEIVVEKPGPRSSFLGRDTKPA